MLDIVPIILFFAIGAALGALYFGGLWLTVRRVTDARRPKTMLLLSFLGRAAIVLAGFYAVTQVFRGQWEALAVAMLGFMGARSLLIRRWKPRSIPSSPTTR
jgi:F1F0 ATPase subunit 2